MAAELLKTYFERNLENLPKNRPTKLIKYINRELGLVFFEKRLFHKPEFEDHNLIKLVGESNLVKAKDHLAELSNFLDYYPVGDKFRDHPTRLKVRDKVRKHLKNENPKFEAYFNLLYVTNNQFNLNCFSPLTNGILFLSLLAENEENAELSNKLKMIYEQLRVKSNNKDDAYDKLTLKKKLKVIHFYEDKIIEVLKLFARN